MAKTLHPKDYLKQEALFTLGSNPLAHKDQASTTMQMMRAPDGLALGSDGETTAFAKGLETPTGDVKKLYAKPPGPGDDGGLITRQVASYRMDQFLGLNSLAEEQFGKDKQGRPIGISIQADGAGVLSKDGLLNVDCTSAKVQRGLSDLEVSDFISGQMDRNLTNVFVDPKTGKVTGIDNDQAFPEVAPESITGKRAEFYVGMPRMVHAETRDKILKTDPDEFRKMLSQPPPNPGPKPMSQAAIDASVKRLEALQDELRNPRGRIQVVKQFDQKTYQAAVDAQEKAFQDELAKIPKDWAREQDFLNRNKGLTLADLHKLSDEDKKKMPRGVFNAFSKVKKTSLLGHIEMEKGINRAFQERPENQNAVGQAARLPQPQRDQADLERNMARGYERMSAKERKDFDKTFEQLRKAEKQLATKNEHLQHPSMLDRLKELTGNDHVQTDKRKHAKALEDDIDQFKQDLAALSQKKLGGKTPTITKENEKQLNASETTHEESMDYRVRAPEQVNQASLKSTGEANDSREVETDALGQLNQISKSKFSPKPPQTLPVPNLKPRADLKPKVDPPPVPLTKPDKLAPPQSKETVGQTLERQGEKINRPKKQNQLKEDAGLSQSGEKRPVRKDYSPDDTQKANKRHKLSVS